MTFRIEIAGGIATGKSTLCAVFKKAGIPVITENIDENLYLKRAYNNKAARGFDVTMAFVISKASALQTWAGAAPIVVADYAMIVEYAYNDVHLKSHDRDSWDLVHKAIDLRRRQLGDPDLLIHLECPVENQIARIKSRGRDFEQGHSADYLQSINDKIRHDVANGMSPQCRQYFIDTARTDITAPEFAKRLMPQIASILMEKRPAVSASPWPYPPVDINHSSGGIHPGS